MRSPRRHTPLRASHSRRTQGDQPLRTVSPLRVSGWLGPGRRSTIETTRYDHDYESSAPVPADELGENEEVEGSEEGQREESGAEEQKKEEERAKKKVKKKRSRRTEERRAQKKVKKKKSEEQKREEPRRR
ncbi:hypothetical protein NDU88_011215 [Pleurodeles waltl]|uniref:Uncharacterized protein n=1 Tax=Pleurodeles waltl TaxID=8319 RepID=A0AAV7QWL0_PLEWA|nr:hypothetical protein NDU88_011215 [Pleurodeles waltl]